MEMLRIGGGAGQDNSEEDEGGEDGDARGEDEDGGK